MGKARETRSRGEITVNLSLERPTGNFWMDMGLVVLINEFGQGEYPVDEILDWLLEKLVQESEQGKTWIYPANLFIKVTGNLKLNLKLSKKPGICDICGDISLLTGAKMWMFPFVVDPDKFANFYSGMRRGLRLCARCALAGVAGYLGWIWKRHGDVFHFFVFNTELRELNRLYREVIKPVQEARRNDRGSNFNFAFFGNYIHETTLGLLLELFKEIKKPDKISQEASRFLEELLGAKGAKPQHIILYSITGESGRAFKMHALQEFSELQSLYRLYETWYNTIKNKFENETRPFERIKQVFEQFVIRRNNDYDTLYRDKIAKAILEFGNPLPFIEQFLFESDQPLLKGTLEILEKYIEEVLNMNERIREDLARFGKILGIKSAEKNEMGLLYSLRNARNTTDFYRVLNDVQFRLQLTVPESLLAIEEGENISGMKWNLLKSLLCIHAMNSFLIRNKVDEKSES